MSAQSRIEWTDRTWNPVRGCSIVSPGCHHCYAMKQAHRFSGVRVVKRDGLNFMERAPYHGLTKLTKAGPQWTGEVRTVPEMLTEPLKWKKPQRIFVNSMSDLFHADVSFAFVDQVFAVMALCPQHTFIVLTKRAERMRDYLNGRDTQADVACEVFKRFTVLAEADRRSRAAVKIWPLPNVHLYVSVENQQTADERIPLLLQTPAAVRGVSAEPLLGPVDLEAVPLPGGAEHWYGLRGVLQPLTEKDTEPDDWKYETRRCARLDHVIVGGESGQGARPCRVAWIRSIVEQCKAAGVLVFIKQLGAKPDGDPRPLVRVNPATGARTHTVMQVLEIRNRKGADPAEWPEDLRVRQMPEPSTLQRQSTEGASARAVSERTRRTVRGEA